MHRHVRVAVAAVALSGLMAGALVTAPAEAVPQADGIPQVVVAAGDHAQAAKPQRCHKHKHKPGKPGKPAKPCKKKHKHKDKNKDKPTPTPPAPVVADPLPTTPVLTAPEPITLSWDAAATTTVAKLKQRIDFPTTKFTATIQPLERTLSGPLELPPAKTSLKLGDLDLVHITMRVADPSPVTAAIQVDDTLWTVSAQQSFAVKITRLSGPANLVNLVKPGCGTARTTASLSGTVDFSKLGQPGGPGDYTMSGTYTIPAFTGCGAVMDGLLTDLVSGPGNALSVHFTG